MIRRICFSLLLLLSLAPLALAQPLVDLLPAETLLALGTEGLNDNANRLDAFIDEFQRLEVGAALQGVFGSAAADAAGEMTVPPELEGLEVLDLLGQEAWIAVSASQFNPLPSITLLTRTSPRATDTFAGLIAENAAESSVEALQEGSVTFYQQLLDAADSPYSVISYAQVGDLLVLSTNPDTLRGVLRRLAGSSEPGFSSSAGYAATLGALGSGAFYGYLDLPKAVALVAPFGRGFGFDSAVDRLTMALNTAGVSGGVLRVVSDGIEGESIAALDRDGGDLALYNLLTTNFGAGDDALVFAPPTALSVTNAYVDLGGWRNYLNEIVSSVPELGLSSFDEAFMMFGLDAGALFFDWAGTRVASVTTGITEAVDPGVAPSNLLGEAVYLIETFDPAAAQAGLSQLFTTVGAMASGFADPSGSGGFVSPVSRDVGGVTVTGYSVIDGVDVSFAVAGGYALIATSDEAMDLVLGAFGSGGGMSPSFADMQGRIPSGARSYTLNDNRATTAGTARTIASQIQLTAGLGGAADLDFDAVTLAAERLEAYLLFVASRLGGSYSYSVSDGGVIRTISRSEVAW